MLFKIVFSVYGELNDFLFAAIVNVIKRCVNFYIEAISIYKFQNIYTEIIFDDAFLSITVLLGFNLTEL